MHINALMHIYVRVIWLLSPWCCKSGVGESVSEVQKQQTDEEMSSVFFILYTIPILSFHKILCTCDAVSPPFCPHADVISTTKSGLLSPLFQTKRKCVRFIMQASLSPSPTSRTLCLCSHITVDFELTHGILIHSPADLDHLLPLLLVAQLGPGLELVLQFSSRERIVCNANTAKIPGLVTDIYTIIVTLGLG